MEDKKELVLVQLQYFFTQLLYFLFSFTSITSALFFYINLLLYSQVEWTRTPQTVKMCVVCLQAVREKLSRGLYSVCVSLHSRLGGPALCWPHLKEQQWMQVTEPVEHYGRICDMRLQINQNLHVVRKHTDWGQ